MAELLLPVLAGDLTSVELTDGWLPAETPRPPNLSADEVAEIRADAEPRPQVAPSLRCPFGVRNGQ